MSVGIPSRRPQFDNLSYVSDGRDRISYIGDPYAAPPRPVPTDGQGIVLQPGDLRHTQGHDNTIYTYRSGQDNLHAYNNAAFRCEPARVMLSRSNAPSVCSPVISVVPTHVDRRFDHNTPIYTPFRNPLENRSIMAKVRSSLLGIGSRADRPILYA